MSYQESPTVFMCSDRRLVGIVTSPLGGQAEVGLIILVGGPQYRAGSHRQFTLLARALAGQGISSLRFDYRGMGDSEGNARDFTAIDADIAAAVDAFIAHAPQLRSVALWGLCDAASAALMYAPTDPRVTRLVLLNPWAPHAPSQARARLKHYYGPKLLQWSLWTKMLAGRVRLPPAIRELLHAFRLGYSRTKARKLIKGTEAHRPTKTGDDCAASQLGTHCELLERMLSALQSFSGKVLFILAGNDLTAHEFLALVDFEPEWYSACNRSGITWELIANASHTFAKAEWREHVERATARFVID